MKKILTGFLIVLTGVFTFATMNLNLFAKEDLIDLYPSNNPKFEEINGNSNWVVEYDGHRWFNTERAVTFVSKFTGFTEGEVPSTEFVEADVPKVRYPSGSGGVIVNDSNVEVTIKVADLGNGTRQNLGSSVTSRFWAYFDQDGVLRMYEDELIKARYLTRVPDQSYWKLSTESEIKQYDDAPEGEKPENIAVAPVRIKMNEDGEGYKAEPLTLGWKVLYGNEEDPQESSVVTNQSRDVVIPAGWTVVRFGEQARNEPVIEWASGFVDKIADLSTDKMTFRYTNPPVKFHGVEALDQNPSVDDIVVIFGYNVEANVDALTSGITSRYIDEQDDKDGLGMYTKYKLVDYQIEIYDEEELLETINVKYNLEDKKYVADPLTKIDTSKFSKEYQLIYKAVSPLNDTVVTKNVIVSIGVLLPQISGLENKFINEGSYLDLYEGLTAWDLENDRDITDSIVITHGVDFNPNNVTYGQHTITVNASWLYEEQVSNTFKYPVTVDPTQKVWEFKTTQDEDPAKINYNSDLAAAASRIPTMYDIDKIDLLLDPAVKAEFSSWGRVVAIFDKDGKLLTKLDRFANATPIIIKADGTTEVMDAKNYKYEDWIQKYMKENTFLIKTHGAGTSVELRAMEVGTSLVDFDFVGLKELVQVTNTYLVYGLDITPPKVNVINPNITVYTDHNYKNISEIVLGNVQVYEVNDYNLTLPSSAGRIDLKEAGEHDISIVVTDLAGNSSTVTFKLTIKEARASEDDLDDKVGEMEDIIKDLEDKLSDSQENLQKAVDSKTTLVMVIVFSVISMVVSIGASVAIIFLKKN